MQKMLTPEYMMKIPPDAIIAREKLTHYLLVFQPKDDKSKFLAQAGFTLENPDALETAIRRLIQDHEALSDKENEYGVYYRVTGSLRGPTSNLDVVTIWIFGAKDGTYRFITLKPHKE